MSFVGCWKIYYCQFCYHKRIAHISHTQPFCTCCHVHKMNVEEWIV